MNRRSLLKLLPLGVAGIALGSTVRTASVASSNNARLDTVQRMVTETPAKGWPSRGGKGSTLVYFGDGPVFEVRFRNEQPIISTRKMTVSESDSLKGYQQRLDRHVPQKVGSVVNNGWRLRGWIYNGRHSSEWIMSVEPI